MYNWVHKADLQPESGKNPDHVAVDETVIQLNDEQYWLYAAGDAETNELRHTTLELTRNTMIAQQFLTEIDEKHDVSEAVFLIDGAQSLQAACRRMSYGFRSEKHGNRNAVERVFREIKTSNSLFLELFQQCHSSNSRRLAQLVQLRRESASLNTTPITHPALHTVFRWDTRLVALCVSVVDRVLECNCRD